METELVAVNSYLVDVLRSLYFLREQGYSVGAVEVQQDNISTQLLETNGKFSNGMRTKHINTKFFFVKDKVDDGEVRIVDCPTEKMWVCVLTKPLQDKVYRVQRATLMNWLEVLDMESGEERGACFAGKGDGKKGKRGDSRSKASRRAQDDGKSTEHPATCLAVAGLC